MDVHRSSWNCYVVKEAHHFVQILYLDFTILHNLSISECVLNKKFWVVNPFDEYIRNDDLLLSIRLRWLTEIHMRTLLQIKATLYWLTKVSVRKSEQYGQQK